MIRKKSVRPTSSERFTDAGEETLQTSVVPLLHLGDEPLVGLMKAVDPLEDVLYNIKHDARDALVAAKTIQRPSGVTLDGIASIYLYTMETRMFREMNRRLRENKRLKDIKPFYPFIKLMLTTLRRLPVYTDTIYRGLELHPNSYSQKIGKCIQWHAFSSCTPKKRIAEYFGGTIIEIPNAKGFDITPYSQFPGEDEVLVVPETYLLVHNVTGHHCVLIQKSEPNTVLDRLLKSNSWNYLFWIIVFLLFCVVVLFVAWVVINKK